MRPPVAMDPCMIFSYYELLDNMNVNNELILIEFKTSQTRLGTSTLWRKMGMHPPSARNAITNET